jgi:hypothetical protein
VQRASPQRPIGAFAARAASAGTPRARRFHEAHGILAGARTFDGLVACALGDAEASRAQHRTARPRSSARRSARYLRGRSRPKSMTASLIAA